MKTRTGFVSNSSSSSFIAYGVSISTSEFIDAIRIWNPGFDVEVAEEWDWGDLKYNTPEEIESFDLVKHISYFDYDNYEIHIGKEWDPENGIDVTAPLLSQSDKKVIDGIINKYQLGNPRQSSGIHYN